MGNKINTDLIERFMRERSLSKAQFCKMCKIAPSTFNKIMKNDHDFYLNALYRIKKIMQIQLFELFETDK